MLPNMTTVPMAEARAVSDTTFAEACALQRAPNEKAPEAIRKVAPYRTMAARLPRNTGGYVSRSFRLLCVQQRLTDIADHHQRRATNHENHAPVDSPTNEWQEHSEESADNVRWHSMQLLGHSGVLGVDGTDDCG